MLVALLLVPMMDLAFIADESLVQAMAPKVEDTLTLTQATSNPLALSTALVRVRSNTIPGELPLRGSGTATAVKLQPNGKTLMLTAGHVCVNPLTKLAHEFIEIRTVLDTTSEGKVIWFNLNPDLCIFEVETSLPAYPISDNYTPRFDDRIISIQAPFGIFPIKKEGSFSFVDPLTGDYFLSLPAAQGSSGSPVIKDGEIIGMLIAIVSTNGSDWSEISIAEPAHRIRDFLSQVLKIIELEKILEEAQSDEASIK